MPAAAARLRSPRDMPGSIESHRSDSPTRVKNDQARTLRHMVSNSNIVALRTQRDRTIAVTGGKGGVGKSTISVNLSVAYARQGARTLTIDADLGMADLNLLLGVAPERSLLDVLRGTPIEDVLLDCHGISLLPALNGSYALATMDAQTRHALFASIDTLGDRFDTLVVDVAAGIGENAIAFAGAVADPVIVATAEPLSLADAYSCLKVLATRQHVEHAFILPNKVRSPTEADDIVGRLESLVARFLGIQITALPGVPRDSAVPEAAAAGVPLVRYRPDSPAARAIKQVARRLDALALPDKRQGVVRLFWQRILKDQEQTP